MILMKSHAKTTGKEIILQTAKADVSNINNTSSAKCRLLFDSGSQRTYIDEKVSKALKLRPIRQERIIINTFRNTQSSLQVLDVVQLKVKHKSENLFVYIAVNMFSNT